MLIIVPKIKTLNDLPELATARLAAVLLGEELECALLGDKARFP